MGQRQEGREWEDPPESERCGGGGEKGGGGAEMDSEEEEEEEEDGAVPRRVLLPASQILQDSVNLFFFAESLKERQQVQELRVIHVVKPGLDRDSVFWVENV